MYTIYNIRKVGFDLYEVYKCAVGLTLLGSIPFAKDQDNMRCCPY